jgi:hypothetical protein
MRYLPYAAAFQAPVHDVLSGPRVKNSHPINWTPDLHRAFYECKANLPRATLLVHPDPSAPLAIVTFAMCAALHQLNACQPFAFFSKKVIPAQQQFGSYDRELVAIYVAVKLFHHMLEARHFITFTDHKLITYTFQQKREKCSPRQFNHLDFVSQFTTGINTS